MAIRLLIADDDVLMRESLKIIIGMDKNFEIVEVVKNGMEAVKHCRNNEIDVALLDVRMPIMNGVEATKIISNETNTKVIILTTFDEDEYIKSAIKNGAKGYILKNNTPDKIKESIKTVASGNTVMQDVVFERIKNNFSGEIAPKIDSTLFTQREMDIIKAISEGLSNKEISQKLFISEGTVKNYISSILSKTNLKHRTQLAIYYLKGGKV